ncbi:hypothetical protein Tco_1031715 [Tanacetum coccineum]|uniref:Uncharacterized protein n=1 Tax=Tanacetum coccineum TaxID=301880 RepID=A0ABQ5G9Z6_9ASTR
MLENHDLHSKIDKYVNEVVKEAVHNALQAPIRERFRDLTEFEMKEILRDQMFKSGSNRSMKKCLSLVRDVVMTKILIHLLQKTLIKARRKDMIRMLRIQNNLQFRSPQLGRLLTQEKLPLAPLSKKYASPSEQPIDDVPIPDDVHLSNSNDTGAAHLPKIKTQSDWLKPLPEDKAPETLDPDWVIPPNDLSKTENNWADALAKTYKDLEENNERDYDISAAYGILHWWFKHKEFYITRHSASSDRSVVRSHMRILSVISLKTFSRYGYTYLKEIDLHKADYNEYKTSEADFKNQHPMDFEDMYLLHLQGKINHLSGADKVHLFNMVNLWIRNIIIRQRVKDLQLGIESYQTKLNLIQPRWDATDFLFKEDYTIIHKTRAIIYRDRNNQKKMMRETEVHKFSDDMLTRILEKLDVMVKDYVLFKFNPGMENRIWSEDDKRKSKEFIKLIERRLKIR